MRANSTDRLAVDGRFLTRFRKWGLTTVQSFLALPGEIVSGHSDRQVVRVVLGQGDKRVTAYLKREHRVRLRDRFSSWWAGFGSLSLAGREAKVLQGMRNSGVRVPKVLAWGESAGRAFILVRAVPSAADLRTFLHRAGMALPNHRRGDLARRLGEIVALVHHSGFDAPDLLSKHVLIHPRRLTLTLLDWPRSRTFKQVSTSRSAGDLARLSASLAGELATTWDRLRCLRAYWRGRGGITFSSFRELLRAVRRAMPAAMRRRSVRDLLRPPTVGPHQRLRWIDGEALVVTRAFARHCGNTAPPWLISATSLAASPEVSEQLRWNGRRVTMQRWPGASLMKRAVARIRGRRVDTAHTRQPGLIFRLQRYGVDVPRVLAFGRNTDGSGFLLTQPRRESRPLIDWLRLESPRQLAVLRRVGAMMARLHEAGVQIGRNAADICLRAGGKPGLSTVRNLTSMPKRAGRWPLSDLGAVIYALGLSGPAATACVRGYLGAGATVHEGRRLAESLRGQLPEPRGAPRA